MPRKLNMDELNRLSIDEFKDIEKFPIVIVLDNIRSLSNIGSVFRTSDAFKVEAIFLCGITATPPHREIHKTALSATESVNWKYYNNTVSAINDLANEGFNIISIEQVENSVKLDNFSPKKGERYALVFGNEVSGVDENVINISNQCVEIPQWGTKHSFNISVSVGIVLWDMILKIK